MKTPDQVKEFIQLRAEGFSFGQIARRLWISRSTLLRWSRKYESEIAGLKAGKLEALREQYCLSVEKKVKMWGRIVEQVRPELVYRSLRNVDSEKLLDMLIKAQGKLEKAFVEPELESSGDVKKDG